ncbi:MAG: hypothetical protein U0892_09945 [Pirellulales bacterium]
MVTLPVVWLISRIVRLAAQVLAIGSHGDEFEMVVGPTGNTSSDYELLSGPAMLSYAMAGQAATLLLSLLGLLVRAAIAPTASPTPDLTLASIFDLGTGWGSDAWASQILWVNGFLFVIHLLPAVPFDTRALLVGWFRITQPQAPSSVHYRALASAGSHLAVLIAGAAGAMILSQLGNTEGFNLWYAAVLISIYLFMISQFELLKSRDEEDIDGLKPRPTLRRDHQAAAQTGRHLKLHAGHQTFLDDELLSQEDFEPAAPVDIDEILRKLHREGRDALSDSEKEALLSASREIQERRRKPDHHNGDSVDD